MRWAPHTEVDAIVRLFPSYRDFVDAALFAPGYGYYSSGTVRFGGGGHYDTYPLALSPLFGRMVAEYAYRRWRTARRPDSFEICEVGAGNGQLCADTVLWTLERGRHEKSWGRFAGALRYRIVERSEALVERQRRHLNFLSEIVTWSRMDVTRPTRRAKPFAARGIVIANEILDCFAHHKVVQGQDGRTGVVFVVPRLRGLAVESADLTAALRNERLRGQLTFEEVAIPIRRIRTLQTFLRRHCPEAFEPGALPFPYFACPAIESAVRNLASLHERSEILWIDYGNTHHFHLETAEQERVFAGPPRSQRNVYDDPGRDDITFMVDFSVVSRACREAGFDLTYFGPQAELARRAEVALDESAAELIVRYRTLGWMLAVIGAGPETEWRRTSLTWKDDTGERVPVRRYVQRTIGEFLGKRPTHFKLLIARRLHAA